MARWIRRGLVAPVLLGLVLPVAGDQEIRPAWMSVDAPAKVVRLRLVAADSGANGTMNFHGHGNGALTVTVPLGWRVEVEFVNRGLGALPHSLVVIEDVRPLPVEGGRPAFPRALTRALVAGLPAGATDSFEFVANREGRFLLFCGVTGHGVAGMWDYLVVSGSAEAPSVRIRDPG